jgi:predicted Zn-dependent protease
MKTKNLIIIISILLAIVSCSRVPITNRKQIKLLPESMLLSLSLTNYNQFLSQNPALSTSEPNTQLVRNTGGKISQAVTKYMKEIGESKRLKNYKWEFNLVKDPTVNAWCMPGGKVVIYTGILPVTKDETGLAVVMSHEIAHAVARHGNERMSQQLAIALGGVSLSVAMQNKPKETQNIFLAVYGIGGTLGSLAYSRQHEYEADKLGMVFMALAGYDPAKAIDFWERMSALSSGSSTPQFLSTHPSNANRIKSMKEFLPKALKYYKPLNN